MAWNPHDPLRIIARVRKADEAFRSEYCDGMGYAADDHSRKSPFHLTPCGRCGAPVWQQPCPICDYYPMGCDDGSNGIVGTGKWISKTAPMRDRAKEAFLRILGKHGNPLAWFFTGQMRTVAYANGAPYRPALDRHLAAAQATKEWPIPEEIWAAYSVKPSDP